MSEARPPTEVQRPSWASRFARAVALMDSLLTPERLRIYPLILICLFVPMLMLSFTGTISGQSPFPDYAARWTAGRMVLAGDLSELYDPAAQFSIQRIELGTTTLSWFVSPPFVSLVFAPLALLPYTASALVWTSLSIGTVALALHLLKPIAPALLVRHWGTFMLLMAASQPMLELLGSGQDSALVLLSFVAGLRLLQSGRDASAGAVLALAAIKPQLVFLVPFLLLGQRRWRALGAFSLVGLVLLAASTALVGGSGFVSWLRLPGEPLYSAQVQQGQAWKGVSLQAWLTSLAPPHLIHNWHMAAVVVGLLLCLPLIAVIRHRNMDIHAVWGLTLVSTVVASPHAMVYDLVALAPVIPLVVKHSWSPQVRVCLAAVFVMTWLIAPLHLISEHLSWPLSVMGAPWPAIALLSLSCLIWRSVQSTGRSD